MNANVSIAADDMDVHTADDIQSVSSFAWSYDTHSSSLSNPSNNVKNQYMSPSQVDAKASSIRPYHNESKYDSVDDINAFDFMPLSDLGSSTPNDSMNQSMDSNDDTNKDPSAIQNDLCMEEIFCPCDDILLEPLDGKFLSSPQRASPHKTISQRQESVSPSEMAQTNTSKDLSIDSPSVQEKSMTAARTISIIIDNNFDPSAVPKKSPVGLGLQLGSPRSPARSPARSPVWATVTGFHDNSRAGFGYMSPKQRY